jgi:hypothetical protein
MERWYKEELDKLTCGDVALRVFGAEQEFEKAASARADAFTKVYELKETLERLQELANEAMRHERYCRQEYDGLKRYLNERLPKND